MFSVFPASFDAEPSGYSLDVDWLIGQTSPSHSTNHVDFTGPSKRDLVINASLNNPRHLQQQQQQQQRPPHPPQARGSTTNPNLPPSTTISTPSSTATTTDLRTIAYGMFHPQHHHHHHLHPHPHHHLPDSATLGRNDLLSYQSQFYPGATLQPVKTGSAAAPHPQQQQQQLAAPAAVMVPAPYAPLQTRSRPVKRRLPVDSPCEGTLPGNYHPHHLASHHNPLTAASLDVTVSKRARWSLTMNPHDLGLHAHVPSPLQARAYWFCNRVHRDTKWKALLFCFYMNVIYIAYKGLYCVWLKRCWQKKFTKKNLAIHSTGSCVLEFGPGLGLLLGETAYHQASTSATAGVNS